MKIVLTRDKIGFYTIKEKDDQRMSCLAYLLTDDVGSDVDWWKNFLQRDQKSTQSNASIVTKENGMIIVQTWWMTDNDGEEYKMILTPEQFIYLLDRWSSLVKQGVSEIVINYNNNTLTVTSPDEN
jgi:hypothetical protein